MLREACTLIFTAVVFVSLVGGLILSDNQILTVDGFSFRPVRSPII